MRSNSQASNNPSHVAYAILVAFRRSPGPRSHRATARARIESHDATFPSTLSRRPAIIPVKLDLRASTCEHRQSPRARSAPSVALSSTVRTHMRWEKLREVRPPIPTRSMATFCTVQTRNACLSLTLHHALNGFCREHCCTFWTPINVHRIPPDLAVIWMNNCCDCAIGAPGLQPCSICGGGLGGTSDEQCYEDVCCEVVRFFSLKMDFQRQTARRNGNGKAS